MTTPGSTPGPDSPAPGASAAETLSALGSNARLGLSAAEVGARLARWGPNDVPEPRSRPLAAFFKKFWGLSAWMLELMAVLSFALHKRTDLVIVLALLVVNAVISFVQEQNASSAVAALRSRLQVTSRVLRDGRWSLVPARELVPGDLIRVRTGDFVPADAQVLDGELGVDQSTLTGESRETAGVANSRLYSGSTVRRGEATAIVVATGARTYFGRTTQLVATARPKLHVEQVVARVVRWLVIIVAVQVGVIVVGSLVRGFSVLDVVPLALVLLLSAIPVALPVMFTVSMAVGARELSRVGVLVTRLNAAEDAASMDVVCADKTGTLTMNRLGLTSVLPEPGFSEEDVIRVGALASHEADQDPIDLAFLRSARERRLTNDRVIVRGFTPFSAETRRTEALLELDGASLRVMKGAVRAVGSAAGLSETALTALEDRARQETERGRRTLAVARSDAEQPMRLVGLAFLSDPLRPDARELLTKLRSLGVRVKMLTGDALPVAEAIARQLDLGRVVRASELRPGQGIDSREGLANERVDGIDGVAEIFPEDKFGVVKALQASGHVVGMTGDGVNDAPALRQAEVGIAVSSATDVAKGAASVVLTNEGLGGIIELVTNGRAIYQRVLTWIINKVSRTVLKTGFVVVPFLVTGRFVVSALTMLLLVFMTDFVKIALSTDRVRASRAPETWDIRPFVVLAVLLGVLLLIESLGALAIGWRWFDLGADAGRLSTFAFLTLLFFALFSLLSVRERGAFWATRPSRTLSIALLADAAVGVLVGVRGVGELAPVSPWQIAFVVGYAALAALVINDFVKRAVIAWASRRSGPANAGLEHR